MIMNKKRFYILALAVGFIQSSQSMDIKEDSNSKRVHQNTLSFHDMEEDYGPQRKRVKQQTSTEIKRLSTVNGHIEYLQEAISSSTNSILITSYGVDDDAFENGNLYDLLSKARKRGVKIYLYNIDSKNIEDRPFKFFEDCQISYDVTYTHAKLLAVDDTRVAIGSFNWLSKANDWKNATLCFSGEECSDLIPLLWKDLKYYRNLQFDNHRQINRYKNNSQNSFSYVWELEDSTTLTYLHSLDSHRDFISDVFEQAKAKVVFCMPFINQKSGYQEDFDKKLLTETIKRKVHIYFISRVEDPNLSSFKNYLGSLLNSEFMHLVPVSDIHLKTVIIDDTTIAEGSFNWLSASRDEESEFHNHEVTLVLEGKESKKLIQDFYKSSVGQEVLKVSPEQKFQQAKSPLENIYASSKQNSGKNLTTPPSNCRKVPNTQPQHHTRWLSLDWKTSKKGNTYIHASKNPGARQTHHIVIIKSQNNAYSALIDGVTLNKWYPSEDQAKLAALDFI